MSFVILDILMRKGPCSWYRLERLAPLHPDFIDFRIPLRDTLSLLVQQGAISRRADKTYSVTDEGHKLLGAIERSFDAIHAVTQLFLDPNKRDSLPQRRFAAIADFGHATQLPIRATFTAPPEESGHGIAFLTLLDPESNGRTVHRGARFRLLEDGLEIGWGIVSFVRCSGTEGEVFDRVPIEGLAVRQRAA